jgi:hypothetical protein
MFRPRTLQLPVSTVQSENGKCDATAGAEPLYKWNDNYLSSRQLRVGADLCWKSNRFSASAFCPDLPSSSDAFSLATGATPEELLACGRPLVKANSRVNGGFISTCTRTCQNILL